MNLIALAFVMISQSYLRQRLLSGAKSYGPMLMSDSPIVAELMAGMGYGHILVDHEHSVTDVRSGQAMLQGIAAAHSFAEPIVRLPSANDSVYMKKVLDTLTLPAGVLVPMVNDAATSEAVVQATRYPNQQGISSCVRGGIRGCAAPMVRASQWGIRKDYVADTERDLLVMVQVETPEGVQAIPDIAAVAGIDGIFLGPYDLSSSIGKMGQFDDPEVRTLITRAERAVLDSNCFLAGFRPPGRDLYEMFHITGYSLICGSVDMALLSAAAKADANAGNYAIKIDPNSTTEGVTNYPRF